MHGPTLEDMDAEREWMVARRRVERHVPQTPQWEAAIEALREREARVRRRQGGAEPSPVAVSNPPHMPSDRSTPRYR
jgi:hypothetical protein